MVGTLDLALLRPQFTLFARGADPSRFASATKVLHFRIFHERIDSGEFRCRGKARCLQCLLIVSLTLSTSTVVPSFSFYGTVRLHSVRNISLQARSQDFRSEGATVSSGGATYDIVKIIFKNSREKFPIFTRFRAKFSALGSKIGAF